MATQKRKSAPDGRACTVTRTSPLLVTMPADLAERIRRLAEKNDRAVRAEIRRALRAHVDREMGD